MGESQLSFDLIQFRNDSSKFAELRDLSCAMEVKLSSSNYNMNKIIYGQKEGEKFNYKIPIPKGFQGNLDLTFYNQLGNYSTIGEEPFIYDVQLLDNLELKTITKAKSIEFVRHFALNPNPAGYYINIAGDHSLIKNVQLYDMYGVLINCDIIEYSSIDISELHNGVYYLCIHLRNGGSEKISFFKLGGK
jgi:hypothetical protein